MSERKQTPDVLADLLSAELKRRRIDRFFEIADQLANQGEPIMSAAEIEAEIEAARAERRQRNARGN